MEIGKTTTVSEVVSQEKTAQAMGSGSLPVYATPAMVALMEKASCACVEDDLEPGQSTVGTRMEVAHQSATPVGMEVSCQAELAEVDGRKLTFAVTARDAVGVIGQGTHERFLIDVKRFMEKTQGKQK